MELSTQIKPITYIKTHAAEVVREIADTGNPLVVTLNGEAKVVMVSVHKYDKDRASLAMLKMLALSALEVKEGKTQNADEIFDRLEAKLGAKKDVAK